MKRILLYILLCFTMASCIDVDEFSNDATGNFEALWTVMDQHYCFFPEKREELGADWNAIHDEYARQIDNAMSRSQLFEFLGGMLDRLQDGHVNLSATFDYSRSWAWKDDYPRNFHEDLQRKYLGKSNEYKIAGGIKYRILDDNTGYMHISTFATPIGDGNLDDIFIYLSTCNGLIIDLRDNGGGQLTEAKKIASRFTTQEVLVGYMRHKTGKRHTDFGDWESISIKPSARVRWTKPVYILTNRSIYSAANEFVKYMKAINGQHTSTAPILTIGDTTGGGSGMPYSNELPNGWSIRMSACPMYDINRQCTEFGIAPDIKVDITGEDYLKGIDTIIETARKRLTATESTE